MDIVQFLLSVINLVLALVVLFGGRFFMGKIQELQDQIRALENQQAIQKVVTQPIKSFLPEDPDDKERKSPQWDV
jgi:Tfp pilus assembly protein PilN